MFTCDLRPNNLSSGGEASKNAASMLRASPSDSPVYSEAQKDINLRYCNSSELNGLIDSLLHCWTCLNICPIIWYDYDMVPAARFQPLCWEWKRINESMNDLGNQTYVTTWHDIPKHGSNKKKQSSHYRLSPVITLFSVCHWLPIYIPGSINMHTLHVWSHLNFNSTTLSIKQASAPASAKDLPTHDNELTWPACVQRVTTHSSLLVQHVNFWIHWWERAKNHTVIL